MNRKQLILLLLVLAIIGGAGLVLFKRNQESWAVPGAKMGDKVLPNFQPNDVAAIHIKGASDLNLARKNDVWRVQERGDYPANFHQISDVLIRLKSLKVVESETVGSSDLTRVNLGEPGRGSGSGTLVEFKDSRGKVIEALLLGKKHLRENSPSPLDRGSPDGRYILLQNDPKDLLLISDALGSLEPMPEAWLSKDFFKVERMKTISVTATNAADSWKLTRETESSPWVLVDPKPGEALDTNKAALTAEMLGYASILDVRPNTAKAGLEQPMLVTIETFDHFNYALKIGAKGPDGNHLLTVTVAAEIPAEQKLHDKLKKEQALAPWVYVVNSWIMEPLLRTRAQIQVEQPGQKAGEAAPTEAK